MVASSSRWNPYWLLVALCSATRKRADRMRAPVSVAIILLQTPASRINSLFASKARQCYIVHCVEHQRNHRDARITRAPGMSRLIEAAGAFAAAHGGYGVWMGFGASRVARRQDVGGGTAVGALRKDGFAGL